MNLEYKIKKYMSKLKQIQHGGNIFNNVSTDNFYHIMYHGSLDIDKTHTVTIPENIILIVPACCGISNVSLLYNYKLGSTELLLEKLKKSYDKFFYAGTKKFYIFDKNDKLCNIQFSIPIGLNFKVSIPIETSKSLVVQKEINYVSEYRNISKKLDNAHESAQHMKKYLYTQHKLNDFKKYNIDKNDISIYKKYDYYCHWNNIPINWEDVIKIINLCFSVDEIMDIWSDKFISLFSQTIYNKYVDEFRKYIYPLGDKFVSNTFTLADFYEIDNLYINRNFYLYMNKMLNLIKLNESVKIPNLMDNIISTVDEYMEPYMLLTHTDVLLSSTPINFKFIENDKEITYDTEYLKNNQESIMAVKHLVAIMLNIYSIHLMNDYDKNFCVYIFDNNYKFDLNSLINYYSNMTCDKTVIFNHSCQTLNVTGDEENFCNIMYCLNLVDKKHKKTEHDTFAKSDKKILCFTSACKLFNKIGYELIESILFKDVPEHENVLDNKYDIPYINKLTYLCDFGFTDDEFQDLKLIKLTTLFLKYLKITDVDKYNQLNIQTSGEFDTRCVNIKDKLDFEIVIINKIIRELYKLTEDTYPHIRQMIHDKIKTD